MLNKILKENVREELLSMSSHTLSMPSKQTFLPRSKLDFLNELAVLEEEIYVLIRTGKTPGS